MDKDNMYSLIMTLKDSKRGRGDILCATDLIRLSGYTNIIDILLLPLYYMWDKLKYGELNEVKFEKYLVKAYTMFYNSARRYTQQIVSLLLTISRRKNFSVGAKSFIMSLIDTYSFLL